MGYQDRSYYRDSGSGAGNPLMWLLVGSVPLFTVLGIRVRAHASFLLFILLVLLFGLGRGSTVEMRVQSMTILFGIVLLHEFGHCFAARATGGDASEIMMTPLGGLAMTMSRNNGWSRLVTVAGGPLVNVVICLICGLGIYLLSGDVLLTPWSWAENVPRQGWFRVYNYLYWIFVCSYILLLFNLLPIFPLDGGQLLQAILWKFVGHYRSMMLMVNIGLGGSVVLGMIGIATLGTLGGGLLLTLIAVFCFINCLNTRRILLAAGPFDLEEDSTDYSAAYETFSSRPRRRSRWAARRAMKLARAERQER
ncbi:MAG TPA: M50 family metallopeptidase, partial [Tepidisphaeraceae bacterium]|nr:M50 family metallopeptidase [Tepidisphaeraceae bacterium]